MKYVKITMAALITAALILSVYFLVTKSDKIFKYKENSGSSSASSAQESDKPVTQETDKATQSDKDTQSTQSGTVQQERPVQGITKFPFYLNNDLKITNVLWYDGAYVEDATFKPCTDIFAIRVENVSTDDLQLARIYITTDKKEAFFEITALPAGKAVVALEKTGLSFAEDEKILNIRLEKASFYPERRSLDKENLKITGGNGTILVENISDKDMQSDAYVYYKYTDGNGDYIGGATFRSKLDSLKSGKSRQIAASAFVEKYSKVVFVEYVSQ